MYVWSPDRRKGMGGFVVWVDGWVCGMGGFAKVDNVFWVDGWTSGMGGMCTEMVK